MLPVCEPGDSYSQPWGEHGFSRCFLQLVGGIACAGILYVLGLGAIVLGKVIYYCRVQYLSIVIQGHLLRSLMALRLTFPSPGCM